MSIKSPFLNRHTAILFKNLFLPLLANKLFHHQTNIKGINNTKRITSHNFCNPYVDIGHALIPVFHNHVINTDPIIASRKIPIFPNKEQRASFNECFGATRFLYNRALEAIKYLNRKAVKHYNCMKKKGCVHLMKSKAAHKAKSGSKSTKSREKQCCNKLVNGYFCAKHKNRKLEYAPINFQYWRNIIVVNNDELKESEKWLSEIPHDTRQLVIRKLMDNIKSAITNLKNGNINKFDLKYLSKKNRRQYFFVDHRAIKKDGHMWPSKFDEPLNMKPKDKKWLNKYMKKHELSQMIITRD